MNSLSYLYHMTSVGKKGKKLQTEQCKGKKRIRLVQSKVRQVTHKIEMKDTHFVGRPNTLSESEGNLVESDP